MGHIHAQLSFHGKPGAYLSPGALATNRRNRLGVQVPARQADLNPETVALSKEQLQTPTAPPCLELGCRRRARIHFGVKLFFIFPLPNLCRCPGCHRASCGGDKLPWCPRMWLQWPWGGGAASIYRRAADFALSSCHSLPPLPARFGDAEAIAHRGQLGGRGGGLLSAEAAVGKCPWGCPQRAQPGPRRPWHIPRVPDGIGHPQAR